MAIDKKVACQSKTDFIRELVCAALKSYPVWLDKGGPENNYSDLLQEVVRALATTHTKKHVWEAPFFQKPCDDANSDAPELISGHVLEAVYAKIEKTSNFHITESWLNLVLFRRPVAVPSMSDHDVAFVHEVPSKSAVTACDDDVQRCTVVHPGPRRNDGSVFLTMLALGAIICAAAAFSMWRLRLQKQKYDERARDDSNASSLQEKDDDEQ